MLKILKICNQFLLLLSLSLCYEKTKKKFYNFLIHFRVISAPTQISGKGEVTPSRADQRFFSIYQFEILTYFFSVKKSTKKNKKK